LTEMTRAQKTALALLPRTVRTRKIDVHDDF
jgi:hypothetical protein